MEIPLSIDSESNCKSMVFESSFFDQIWYFLHSSSSIFKYQNYDCCNEMMVSSYFAKNDHQTTFVFSTYCSLLPHRLNSNASSLYCRQSRVQLQSLYNNKSTCNTHRDSDDQDNYEVRFLTWSLNTTATTIVVDWHWPWGYWHARNRIRNYTLEIRLLLSSL